VTDHGSISKFTWFGSAESSDLAACAKSIFFGETGPQCAAAIERRMRLRKKVEMLFAHLKRILGLGRLRLRGPCGANDEFLLAATAQNLWKLAKIFPAPQQTRKA